MHCIFYLYYQAEDLCKNTRCKFNWHRCKYNGQCISALSHRTWRIGRLVAAFWCCCRIIAFFAVVYAVLSQLHKACNSEKKGAKKAVYKEKTLKVSSASKALLRKERMMFTGNATYMLNSGLSALIMVGGTIYAVSQLNTLKQFPSTLIEMISVYLPLVIAFVISMGPISAASISMEAKKPLAYAVASCITVAGAYAKS